jgi:hypothetical protein
MPFRSVNLVLCIMGLIFLMTGWSCGKSGNRAGIPDNTVVTTIGDHKITFGDWMRELDMETVFMSQSAPNSKDQIKKVLDSMVEREMALAAAQKAGYQDPTSGESQKADLSRLETQMKSTKEGLEKKLEAIRRVQNSFAAIYKKQMLAGKYTSTQAGNVVVTDQEVKDWFDQFSVQAKLRGQNLPPYAQIKDQVKARVQQEKFSKQLRDQFTVMPNNDVIDKYLATLPEQGQGFGLGGSNPPVRMAPPSAK